MNLKAINISSELYHLVEKQLSELGFETVDEYITFILQELLMEDAGEKTVVNPNEERRVKKRLKDLGYL